MKTTCPLVLVLALTLLAGCADKRAIEQKARDDAEAKARAEAARKEMEAVPKVFRPQYYNKRLEPESKSTSETTTKPTTKS